MNFDFDFHRHFMIIAEIYPKILLTVMVLLFSFTPMIFLFIQQKGVQRQRAVLNTATDELKKTSLWCRANEILDRRHFTASKRRAPAVNRDASTFAYFASLTLVSLIMFSSWGILLGEPFGIDWYTASRNLFLSGTQVATAESTVQQIQERTLAASCVAFSIAYVIVIGRMVIRLNINELNSIENLFDAVQLISAIIVSTVGATILALMKFGPIVITMFAIATGVRPDFYLQALGRMAYLALTAEKGPFSGLRATEADPVAKDKLPAKVDLQFIEGITDDVADRLHRIDIGSCHRLAFHNPFIIWVRTSFLLPEIVDWTGQALLWTYFGDRIVALKADRIRTIDDLLRALELGRPLAAFTLDDEEAKRMAAQLSAVPQVRALHLLSKAMLAASDPR